MNNQTLSRKLQFPQRISMNTKMSQFGSQKMKETSQKHEERLFGKDMTNWVGGNKGKRGGEHGKKQENRSRSATEGRGVTDKEVQHPAAQQKDILKEFQYTEEITQTLLQFDRCYRPLESGQITDKMRAILIDWLIDVHDSFRLTNQTLHLCLRCLQEYSSKVAITKSQFQLVGITCLWISSKFEEIYPPLMHNFLDMTANAYQEEQLLEMQSKILTTLSFYLTQTTHLAIFQVLSPPNSSFLNLCLYLSELSYVEGLTKKYCPSTISLASSSLACSLLKVQCPKATQLRNRFKTKAIIGCFQELCRIMAVPNRYDLTAVRRKYGQERYDRVAQVRLHAMSDQPPIPTPH